MTVPERPKTLAAAIVAAQAAAKNVGLDGWNDHAKYAYASAEAMIEAGKECLAACGLAIVPMGVEIMPAPQHMVDDSKVMDGQRIISAVLGVARHTWSLVHESGESWGITRDWPIVQAKGRPADRATAGANTAALGYLLRDLLQFPRTDENTNLDDPKRDEPEKPAPKQAAKPAPVAKEPSPEEERAREASKGLLRDLRDLLRTAKSTQSASDVAEKWLEANGPSLTKNGEDIARTYAAAIVAQREGEALNAKQTRAIQAVQAL